MQRKDRAYIIAEIGVNHNGRLAEAIYLVNSAKNAGADAVKFQTFQADKIATAKALKVSYQLKASHKERDQRSMLKRLELDASAYKKLFAHCKKQKIDCLSTAFDDESVDLLFSLGMKVFKIPSGEITNVPLIRKIASVASKVILSTGMSTLKEVDGALNILQKAGIKRNQIIVLQCNTEYPTPASDVNLKAMVGMKDQLKVEVGYSDHTMGIEAALAAIALGACVIEKHFTRSRLQKGPDHRSSLEFQQFKSMVGSIRTIEQMLGDGIKKPSPSEKKNILNVRRSIVASKDIVKGERLSAKNLTTKRPAHGRSPLDWDKVIGTKASKNYVKDELI